MYNIYYNNEKDKYYVEYSNEIDPSAVGWFKRDGNYKIHNPQTHPELASKMMTNMLNKFPMMCKDNKNQFQIKTKRNIKYFCKKIRNRLSIRGFIFEFLFHPTRDVSIELRDNNRRLYKLKISNRNLPYKYIFNIESLGGNVIGTSGVIDPNDPKYSKMNIVLVQNSRDTIFPEIRKMIRESKNKYN